MRPNMGNSWKFQRVVSMDAKQCSEHRWCLSRDGQISGLFICAFDTGYLLTVRGSTMISVIPRRGLHVLPNASGTLAELDSNFVSYVTYYQR